MTEGWRCNGSVSRKTAPFPGKRSRFPESWPYCPGNGPVSPEVAPAARKTSPFLGKLVPLPGKLIQLSGKLPTLPGNRPCFPESWPRCRKNGRPAPAFPSPSGEGGANRRMRGGALAQNLHLHPLQSVEAAMGSLGSLGPHLRSFVSRPILIPSALIRRAGYRGADISEEAGSRVTPSLFARLHCCAPCAAARYGVSFGAALRPDTTPDPTRPTWPTKIERATPRVPPQDGR
jgi:hypothetical protein